MSIDGAAKMKMEAALSSETSVKIHRDTECPIFLQVPQYYAEHLG